MKSTKIRKKANPIQKQQKCVYQNILLRNSQLFGMNSFWDAYIAIPQIIQKLNLHPQRICEFDHDYENSKKTI